MNFIKPDEDTLSALRGDPILFEQELDARPEVARSLERILGLRSGRVYWRGAKGTLYALELGDFGRGHPSMAIIYAFWPRYEPRPLNDEEIDKDLEAFMLWMGEVCDGLDREDVQWTLDRSPRAQRR